MRPQEARPHPTRVAPLGCFLPPEKPLGPVWLHLAALWQERRILATESDPSGIPGAAPAFNLRPPQTRGWALGPGGSPSLLFVERDSCPKLPPAFSVFCQGAG